MRLPGKPVPLISSLRPQVTLAAARRLVALLLAATVVLSPRSAWGADVIAVPDDAANRIVLLDGTSRASLGDAVPPSEHISAPLACIAAGPVSIGGHLRPRVLLVSDFSARRIVAFDPQDGAHLGVLAENLDVRGMTIGQNGALLVASGRTGVRSIDLITGQITTRIAARKVDGPNNAFGLLVRPPAVVPENEGLAPEALPYPSGDLLVSDVTLDAIWRYDAAGQPRGAFARLDSFKFIEQLALRSNGNVLAADTFGGRVYEFDRSGVLLRSVSVLRPRGVLELVNGNLLIAAEGGLLEFDQAGDQVAAHLPGYPDCAPRFLATVGCRALAGDLDGDGRISNFDVDPFVQALVDPAAFALAHPTIDRLCAGDINRDGRMDFFDIDPFVNCLLDPPTVGVGCH